MSGLIIMSWSHETKAPPHFEDRVGKIWLIMRALMKICYIY